MEEVQKLLHDYRKDIDGLLNKLIALKDVPQAKVAARNLAISYTHLEDARMRLGKALEDTGSSLPAQYADKANAAPANNGQQTQTQSATPAAPADTGNQAQPAQPAADPNANGGNQAPANNQGAQPNPGNGNNQPSQ